MLVPLFTLLLATANCGSSSEDGGDGADSAGDETTAAEGEALEKDTYGTCIKVGITTHGAPFVGHWWHAYVRDRKTLPYGTSELKLEVQGFPPPSATSTSSARIHAVTVFDRRGHEQETTWDQGTFARAWGWDPCSNAWVHTDWVAP
jgi:hypothetical protein